MVSIPSSVTPLDWDLTNTAAALSAPIEEYGGGAWTTLSATNGVTYYLAASTFGLSADDAEIFVYDSAGNELAHSLFGETSALSYTATATGPVFIEVTNSSDHPGFADLFVTTLAATLALAPGAEPYTANAGERVAGGIFANRIDLATGGMDALGGRGDDILLGNDLDNHLSGGRGDDFISGGAGNDTIWGGAGNDFLEGIDGNDLIYGGDDTDVISGGGGVNQLHGGAGADVMFGGVAVDTMFGDAGNDRLIGDAGNDNLRGGAGADRLDGGDGFDTAMYSEAATGVAVNLGTGAGTAGIAQGDTLFLIESVYGGAGNDGLIGSSTDDVLSGGAGNDVLIGQGGRDVLVGGVGADRFTYGSTGQSPVGNGSDQITDFSHAQGDRIDLASIDANTVLAGNQAFAFIGAAAFGHHAGELRAVSAGGVTSVFGDVNGDAVADFQIRATGTIVFVAADFVL